MECGHQSGVVSTRALSAQVPREVEQVRRSFVAGLVYSCVVALQAQAPAPHLPPLDRALPPRAEAIFAILAPRVDTGVAVDAVKFMSQYWRLAGNPGYD